MIKDTFLVHFYNPKDEKNFGEGKGLVTDYRGDNDLEPILKWLLTYPSTP